MSFKSVWKQKGKDMQSWRCVSAILFILSLGLLIAVIVLGVLYHNLQTEKNGEASINVVSSKARLSDDLASSPSIFSGLTGEEFSKVVSTFMETQRFNLKRASEASTTSNYIHLVEHYLPKKSEVLQHLDHGAARPAKLARVTLFLGEDSPPTVAEYMINVQSGVFAHLRTHPWIGKPVDSVEENDLWDFVATEFASVEHIIMESYNVSFKKDCGEYCPIVYFVARALPDNPHRHVFCLITGGGGRHAGPFVHGVNFSPVIRYDASTKEKSVVKIFYNGIAYDSIAALQDAYNNNKIEKLKVFTNPAYYDYNYGSGARRGKNFNEKGNRDPFLAFPDGQRFTVDGTHVSYLGWSFDVHFRSLTVCELMDIRYDNVRIAYELSMEDMYVLYAGDVPDNFYRNYYDSTWLLGSSAQSLIHGVDCPYDAHYFDALHYAANGDGETYLIKDALCVFEHLNSVPLRRHTNTAFGFGLSDTVLIVRQIITVGNYDYVIDNEFHATGMIELKISSTGYIQTTIVSTSQDFGYKLDTKANNIGNMHTHAFNFRIDLDILGTKNHFKKIHFLPKTVENPVDSSKPLGTMYFTEENVTSEAGIAYDFQKPKHYIVANNKEQNPQGNTRGYRITSSNFFKIVIPENDTRLNAAGWSKKQLFVTKHNENERSSTSITANGNPHNPVLDFTSFVNDESIDGEDLVAWVAVGLQHLPVAEDLPVTTTPGKQLSVILTPFNYFQEDPSISAPTAVVFSGKTYLPQSVKDDVNVCVKPHTHPFLRN